MTTARPRRTRTQALTSHPAAQPSTQTARQLLDARISEKAFQAQVLRLANLHGWLAYHPYDSRRSERGWPDVALVRGNRLVFCELKTMKGRLSAAQKVWLERLRETANEVYVFRPSDWRQIEQVLA